MGMFDFITGPINKVVKGVTDIPGEITGVFNQVVEIFKKVQRIFNCLTAFFDFVGELCKYVVRFVSWVFIHFFPWLSQYIECAFYKITSLPNCFLWYSLDTIGFIIYLPFRFTFWLIDTIFNLNSTVQNLEHDFWGMLDYLDEYIHNEGEGKLGTGYHIIHFPDTVIEKCYKCSIKCLTPMPCVKNLNRAYRGLKDCGSGDVPDELKKCGKPSGNFEKC